MAFRRVNTYSVVGAIAFIDVSTPKHPGTTAVIDAEDLPLVMDGGGRWGAVKRSARTPYVSRRGLLLHRHILGITSGDVDHADRDGLNNRRFNLRPATRTQNLGNMDPRSGGASRFKGVSIDREDGKLAHWRAGLTVAGRTYYLGRFYDEESAARAYDAAAREHFGEFARTNFQEDARVLV